MSPAGTFRQRADRAASGCRTRWGRRGLRRGVLPTLAPQQILRRLSPSLVIDVGANRGQFALDVVTAVPGATVVCFEPLRSEADVFESVFDGHPLVHLRRFALSDEAGPGDIHVSAHADSSSLNRLSRLQSTTFPGTQEVRTESVDVIRLDNVSLPLELPSDSLLKLDVQGHELEALRGCGDLLQRIRWVLVEVSFIPLYEQQALAAEVVSFLVDRGFGLIDAMPPVVKHQRAVQMDLVFAQGGE